MRLVTFIKLVALYLMSVVIFMPHVLQEAIKRDAPVSIPLGLPPRRRHEQVKPTP